MSELLERVKAEGFQIALASFAKKGLGLAAAKSANDRGRLV